MCFTKRVVICAVAVVLATCASAPAEVIALHSGSADPTTEDWTWAPGSGTLPTTGAVSDTPPSWKIVDDATDDYSIGEYTYSPTAQNEADGNTNGWILKAILRLPGLDEAGSIDAVDYSVAVGYQDGLVSGTCTRWFMLFGFDGTNPQVEVSGSGSTYTVTGKDDEDYVTYELRYDPTAKTADLYVDDAITTITDFGGSSSTSSSGPVIEMGSMASGTQGAGYYNTVEWAIVPEPSTLMLLAAGGLALLLMRRWRKK